MFKLKHVAISAALLAAGLVSTTATQAQDYDNRANVYGGAVNYFFDSKWDLGDDQGWLVGGEVPVSERVGLAIERYRVSSANKKLPGNTDFSYLNLSGNYLLAPHGIWQPYVSAGVGLADSKDRANYKNNADRTGFNLGLGTKLAFSDHLFVRGDIKAVRVNDIKSLDFAVALAVGYAFGPKPRPAPVVQAPVAEMDSDGDGVMDSRDKCPGTPRNLAVDADGCPIMDSSMVSQDLLVQFDFDKSEIKPEFYSRIAEFAQFMTTYTNTNVVIEGHTDSVGADAYNQGLSERRAQAVMNRLITTHGIAASRLTARGFGESMPRANNDTAANRALNRRIMAEVAAQVQEQRQR